MFLSSSLYGSNLIILHDFAKVIVRHMTIAALSNCKTLLWLDGVDVFFQLIGALVRFTGTNMVKDNKPSPRAPSLSLVARYSRLQQRTLLEEVVELSW